MNLEDALQSINADPSTHWPWLVKSYDAEDYVESTEGLRATFALVQVSGSSRIYNAIKIQIDGGLNFINAILFPWEGRIHMISCRLTVSRRKTSSFDPRELHPAVSYHSIAWAPSSFSEAYVAPIEGPDHPFFNLWVHWMSKGYVEGFIFQSQLDRLDPWWREAMSKLIVRNSNLPHDCDS